MTPSIEATAPSISESYRYPRAGEFCYILLSACDMILEIYIFSAKYIMIGWWVCKLRVQLSIIIP